MFLTIFRRSQPVCRAFDYQLYIFLAKNIRLKIYTIENQKHEQRIRCGKIAPYGITSIYNPPENDP
jgi:hypothetical protein